MTMKSANNTEFESAFESVESHDIDTLKQNDEQAIRINIYLLLSTLLRQAPTQEVLDFLTELEIDDQNSEMSVRWGALKDAAMDADIATIKEEYQTLFIGIGRGEVMPFASWHITGSIMEKPLTHLRQQLAMLGFEREEHVKEPEDHFAVICEVMSYLCDAPYTVQQAFFNENLATWYTKFTRQINEAKYANFYREVARFIDSFFMIEQVRFSQTS